MTTVSIPPDLARRLHKVVDGNLKTDLEKAFPAGYFGDILQRVITFEAACAELGKDPNDPFYSACRPHENAIRKLETVIEALNEGEVLSFSNPNTKKWRIWVIWDEAIGGFRFNGTSYVLTTTDASLGSRLCLVSETKAVHLAKHFLPLIIETLQ
jgi:hypothetical protein